MNMSQTVYGNTSNAEPRYINRVREYPLKGRPRKDFSVETLTMNKFFHSGERTPDLNYNFVFREIAKIEKAELSYDEKESLSRARDTFSVLAKKKNRDRAYGLLSDALMTLIKLSKYA